MLNEQTAARVLAAALETGGDFAEIFYEDTQTASLQMLSARVEEAVAGRDHGAGIRVFREFGSVYVYTNDTSLEGLLKAARQAAAAIGSEQAADAAITLAPTAIASIHPVRIPPSDVSAVRKAEILRAAYHAAKDYDPSIVQVTATYMDRRQQVTIANSEGLFVSDERTRVRLGVLAVAGDGRENQSGFNGPGGQMGFEFFDSHDPAEYGRDAARTAVTMLRADLCPAGPMTIAIESGFGGVLFHEACGHALEATSVAKGHSVFVGKLGQTIASDVVTAIDDATIPGAWGSGNIDDEGTACRRNVLIEKGVLKGYLIDRLNGRRMGMASTGSARRQSYAFAPTSRMSNTFIDAGDSSDEDIIASIASGLYCVKMGGGSVNPLTGSFNFAVSEGYLVKNGKIDKPVRGATLIGKGEEILRRIDMVGRCVKTEQGMCGSLSGSVPADVGQPLIRISEIVVGGRQEGKQS
jgi:TldD protein